MRETAIEIPLVQINTFDATHIAFGEGFICTPYDSMQTMKHRATIDLMKICILEGQMITPILVKMWTSKYQRLDGFCRYWAYKELGRKLIPCYIGSLKGGQSGLNPFVKP